jgi:hypothetical protein
MKRREFRNIALIICFFSAFSFLYIGGKFLFASSAVPADYTGPSENLFNLKIPKDLHFAGELIPKNDYSIKENMEKVFRGGNFEKSTAYILFSRAATWFPLIENILRRNHIPDDFKYVALAESRLTNSTSPQGAVGFWQLIGSTARNYGLEVSDEVDERYNVEKSTEAACKFLKEAYKKFGNWTLCAAAYNLGMGGIEYHLKKQPSKDYYDLMMNKETSFYIYHILALKTVFLNSGKKFHGGGRNIYNIPCMLVPVDSTINDLAEFARKKNYSYDILKTFNPWLLGNKLSNPEGKRYLIRFPKKEYLAKLGEETTLPKTDSLLVPATVKTDSVQSDTVRTDLDNISIPLKKDTEKNEPRK